MTTIVLFTVIISYSVFGLYDSVRFLNHNPLYLSLGLASLILCNLFFYRFIRIDQGVLTSTTLTKLLKNIVVRYLLIALLWLLAIGNFISGFLGSGSPFLLNAVIVTILAHLTLRYKS